MRICVWPPNDFLFRLFYYFLEFLDSISWSISVIARYKHHLFAINSLRFFFQLIFDFVAANAFHNIIGFSLCVCFFLYLKYVLCYGRVKKKSLKLFIEEKIVGTNKFGGISIFHCGKKNGKKTNTYWHERVKWIDFENSCVDKHYWRQKCRIPNEVSFEYKLFVTNNYVYFVECVRIINRLCVSV